MAKVSGNIKRSGSEWKADGLAKRVSTAALRDYIDKNSGDDGSRAVNAYFKNKVDERVSNALYDAMYEKSRVEGKKNESQLFNSAPDETVKTAQLHPVQGFIGSQQVKNHLPESKASGLLIVRREGTGEYYVFDGTHRAVAAILRGDKTVKGKIVTVKF